MTAKSNTAVVEPEAKTVATVQPAGLPARHDYGEDAGGGFEGTTGAELAVPYLGVLQSNSPQVEDKNPPDAEPGMLFNSVTHELRAATVGQVFQPCHKEQAYVEWIPRDQGGGIVGIHDPNGDVVKKAIENNDGERFGKLKTGENDLIETFYVYGMLLDDTGTTPEGFAVISFSSTKIKPYRHWTTAMFGLFDKPPIWANRARITTVKQKNDSGTFYNFQIDPFDGKSWGSSLIDPKENPDLLKAGKDFRNMVLSGMARADFTTADSTGDGAGGQESSAPPF